MGSFNGFILTDNGKKLLEEALTGKRLIFTKFQFGDGETTEDPKKVIKLVSVNKETTINQIENSGNGQVMLRVIINNKDVDTGYYIKEIGVFAKCDDGEEVLYVYNKAMKPDYLPVYNGINLVELEYQNYITIAQIEDVTAIIDENFTYLTKEEANEKFVKQTQLAMEEKPGIITLNEVYEASLPNRGELILKDTITYQELWDLKHGQYLIRNENAKKIGIMELYGYGILSVYKPLKLDIENSSRLFKYYSHTIGLKLSLNSGMGILNLYEGTVRNHPNSKITDTVENWSDKWIEYHKKEIVNILYNGNLYIRANNWTTITTDISKYESLVITYTNKSAGDFWVNITIPVSFLMAGHVWYSYDLYGTSGNAGEGIKISYNKITKVMSFLAINDNGYDQNDIVRYVFGM